MTMEVELNNLLESIKTVFGSREVRVAIAMRIAPDRGNMPAKKATELLAEFNNLVDFATGKAILKRSYERVNSALKRENEELRKENRNLKEKSKNAAERNAELIRRNSKLEKEKGKLQHESRAMLLENRTLARKKRKELISKYKTEIAALRRKKNKEIQENNDFLAMYKAKVRAAVRILSGNEKEYGRKLLAKVLKLLK